MQAFYRRDIDGITFLNGDTPDITALELWRVGATRIYRPGDYPDVLITIDPHGHQRVWPLTFMATSPPPSVAPNVNGWMESPVWIDYGEITYGLDIDEIAAFDRWVRDPEGSAPPPSHAHWEEYTRPVLVPAHPPDPFEAPPVLTAPQPAPSAPLAEVRQPDLPIHIQRLVIDAAIAAGATCPITMEPITADTAIITPCGHVFGTELTGRVSLCPVCRSCL